MKSGPNSEERLKAWSIVVEILFHIRSISIDKLEKEKQEQLVSVGRKRESLVDAHSRYQRFMVDQAAGKTFEEWAQICGQSLMDSGVPTKDFQFHCAVLKVWEKLLEAVSDGNEESKRRVMDM